MRQLYLHHFSLLKFHLAKFLLAFAFVHMASISFLQAMEGKHNDIILEDHNFSHLHFNNDQQDTTFISDVDEGSSDPVLLERSHEIHRENFKDLQSSSLLSSFSSFSLTKTNESLLLSASFLQSWAPYDSGPLSTSLTDSMILTNDSTSYHWRYLEYVWLTITNNITSFSLPSFSYFSSQSPDGNPLLSDLNGSFLPSDSSLSSNDLDESSFGFHYIKDTSDDTNTNT